MNKVNVKKLNRQELLSFIQKQSFILELIEKKIQENLAQELYALRIQLSLFEPVNAVQENNINQSSILIKQAIDELRNLVGQVKSLSVNT